MIARVLRCMLRWRDTSGGESAHYVCQWADEEGAWWEATLIAIVPAEPEPAEPPGGDEAASKPMRCETVEELVAHAPAVGL